MESLFSALTSKYAPGSEALAITGSYARGDAHAFSDIDLLCFVAVSPGLERERYHLEYLNGRLVSISAVTFEEKYNQISRPETAIYAVPGLRQCLPLWDPQKKLQQLKEAAQNFNWAPLQPAADRYASEELMGFAEEVHKILGALDRRDESSASYALLGLVSGLSRAVAVQKGLMIETENGFFDQVQAAAGAQSPWTRAFRLAAGLEYPSTGMPLFASRAKAGLDLYVKTADLLSASIQTADRPVIETTLALIISR
jgi:hypothetical protein